MVMTTVERFERIMDFKPVDRLPMIEWAPYWEETINRWRQEGLSSTLMNPDDICFKNGPLVLPAFFRQK